MHGPVPIIMQFIRWTLHWLGRLFIALTAGREDFNSNSPGLFALRMVFQSDQKSAGKWRHAGTGQNEHQNGISVQYESRIGAKRRHHGAGA